MKKLLHYLLCFVTVLMLCSVFVVKNETNIDAKEATYRECQSSLDFTLEANATYDGCSSSIGSYGNVLITKEGGITLSYKYGISELLVYVYKGTYGTASEKGQHLIHVSGRKVPQADVKKDVWGSVTVHLFKYIAYDEKVNVALIYEFATESHYNSGAYESNGEDKNEGFFKPLFCKTSDNLKNCWVQGEDSAVIGNNDKLKKQITVRGDHFLKSRNQKSVPITYQDRYSLVYSGKNVDFSENGSNPDWQKMDLNLINTGKDIFAEATANLHEISLIVDNSSAVGAEEEVEKMVYGTIIPVALGVLGLAAVVTCTVLGYQIVKSADSPEERSNKIKTLKSVLIGLAIAFIMLLVVKPVINFVKGFLE